MEKQTAENSALAENPASSAQDALVEVVDGQTITNSMLVADMFEKRHDNVIRDIENLISQLKNHNLKIGVMHQTHDGSGFDHNLKNEEMVESNDATAENHIPNFEDMFRIAYSEVHIGSGAVRQDKYYQMNRDGFALLAMGFTGERALRFKLEFIRAFNAMESYIRQDLQERAALAEQRMNNAAMMGYSFADASDLLRRVHYGYTRLMLTGARNEGNSIIPQDIDEQLEYLQHLQGLFEEKYIAKQQQLLK